MVISSCVVVTRVTTTSFLVYRHPGGTLSSTTTSDSLTPVQHDGLLFLGFSLFCVAEMVGIGWAVGLFFPAFGLVAGCAWAVMAIVIAIHLDPLDCPPWLQWVKRFCCWLVMSAIVSPGLFLGSYLASHY